MNEDGRQRGPIFEIPPEGLSFFGVEWRTTTAPYRFNNSDLVRDGLLTRPQVQTLSRMTHDSHRVVGTLRGNFLNTLAAATAMHLALKRAIPENDMEAFEDSLRIKLHVAARRDLNFLRQVPLARDIGERFAELTGIPLPQLVDILTEGETQGIRGGDGLYELLRPHLRTEQ